VARANRLQAAWANVREAARQSSPLPDSTLAENINLVEVMLSYCLASVEPSDEPVVFDSEQLGSLLHAANANAPGEKIHGKAFLLLCNQETGRAEIIGPRATAYEMAMGASYLIHTLLLTPSLSVAQRERAETAAEALGITFRYQQ
jgi:hypothetical protein